ncbi:hypothetical protein L218DRAFT_986329 [Marasmius fiardii PR-910]|nr:hypothetical protein L218DRAFT_986329 [Marasmius fiardii PR-910]
MSVNMQELVSYLEKNEAVLLLKSQQFVEAAGLVILIYDYFLTLGPEISFVWTRGPWNIGKLLFFLVRYSGFVSGGLLFYVDVSRSIPLQTCPSWMSAGFYSNICVVAIVEFVLGLRVWALWGRSKRIVICLGVTTSVLTTFVVYKLVTQSEETQTAFSIVYYRLTGRCPPQYSGNDGHSGSDMVGLSFIMIIIYEFVVLGLTLLNATSWSGMYGSESDFVNGFISQGMAYNCLILLSSTANVIVRFKLPSAYVNILTYIQLIIHSVLTSRMMLYLRRNAFQRGTFHTNETLTGLVVVDPGSSDSGSHLGYFAEYSSQTNDMDTSDNQPTTQRQEYHLASEPTTRPDVGPGFAV